MRLNVNTGTLVPGSWLQAYGPRNSNGIGQAAMSGMCVLYPASGDDVTLELISRELGGDSWDVALTLVELPSGTESAAYEATGGLINQSTAAVFVWDTVLKSGTGFVTGATQSNIEVSNDGAYIVMANMGYTTAAGGGPTRAVPSLQFRVESTNNNYAGGTMYSRNSSTADHGHVSAATLLHGVNAAEDIHCWNDSTFSQNTGTMVCNNGAFAAIRLSSLFAVPTPPHLPYYSGAPNTLLRM